MTTDDTLAQVAVPALLSHSPTGLVTMFSKQMFRMLVITSALQPQSLQCHPPDTPAARPPIIPYGPPPLCRQFEFCYDRLTLTTTASSISVTVRTSVPNSILTSSVRKRPDFVTIFQFAGYPWVIPVFLFAAVKACRFLCELPLFDSTMDASRAPWTSIRSLGPTRSSPSQRMHFIKTTDTFVVRHQAGSWLVDDEYCAGRPATSVYNGVAGQRPCFMH